MRFHGRYVLSAALVALTVASPAWATFPGRNGDISFNRFAEADGSFKQDLFTVDPDRRTVFQVTAFGFDTFSELPDYSPDGRKLAFQRFDFTGEDSDPTQIWLVDADGSDPRQLTAFTEEVFDPAFSPSGHLLAVDAFIDGKQGIYVIPAHTLGKRPLSDRLAFRVTHVSDGGFDSEPQFSPDGRWIVFTRYSVECTLEPPEFDDCQTRIMRVRTSGRDLQQLVGPQLNPSAPDYHPSGRLIAFDTGDNALAPNVAHIMVMDADGSDKRIIVRADADSYYNNPTFSPDGRQIAYAHWPLEPDNNAESSSIFTARIDGSKRRQITEAAFDNKPDWGSKAGHGHH